MNSTEDLITKVSDLAVEIHTLKEQLKTAQLEIEKQTRMAQAFKKKYSELCYRLTECVIQHKPLNHQYTVSVNFPEYMNEDNLEVGVIAHLISTQSALERSAKA